MAASLSFQEKKQEDSQGNIILDTRFYEGANRICGEADLFFYCIDRDVKLVGDLFIAPAGIFGQVNLFSFGRELFNSLINNIGVFFL